VAFESVKNSDAAQRISAFYEKLALKDQQMVKILTAFVMFVVIIFGFVIPASNYHSAAIHDYQKGVDTLSWMEANKAPFAGAQKAGAKRDPSQSLLSIANNSSKKFNISFKRYEPVGDDGLSLWLDDTVFNNMIVWLELLDKRHGIQVKEIAVDRQDKKGLVNVRLVLQG
jgi:general secretion pathway protein M